MTQRLNRNPKQPRAAPPSTRRRSTTRGALAAGASLLALGALLLLRGPGSDELPPELFGRWTTTNPRYEGRAFTLSESTVEIHTSPSRSTVHQVRGVEKDDSEGLVYTLRYEEDGALVPFAIAYGARAPSGAPQWVHFPHQPEIEWRKANDR
jgi:hypothetical protein